jgi:hypothetical protein
MGNGRPTTNRPDAAWAPLISTLVIGMLYTAGAAIFGGLAAMRFQRETV